MQRTKCSAHSSTDRLLSYMKTVCKRKLADRFLWSFENVLFPLQPLFREPLADRKVVELQAGVCQAD